MAIDTTFTETKAYGDKNGAAPLAPWLQKRQVETIARCDPDSIYEFAKNIPGADIPGLQSALINSGNGSTMVKFARDIPGADVTALQAAVIERAWYPNTNMSQLPLYLFAKEAPGADVAALQDALLKSKDATTMTRFAADIPGADIAALQAAAIKSGDADGLLSFAKHVPGADVLVLWHAVCDTRNEEVIGEFRVELGSKLDQLQARSCVGAPELLPDFEKLLASSGNQELQAAYKALRIKTNG